MQIEALGQLVQSYEKRIYWSERNCLEVRRVLQDHIRQLQAELKRARANSKDYLGYTQPLPQLFPQLYIHIEGAKQMSDNFTTNAQGATIGSMANVVKDHAQMRAIQTIDASTKNQEQTLIQIATDVEKILQPFEQTHPNAPESDQVAYLNDEAAPSFRRRIVQALKAAGETALDELVLENKYLKVAKAAAKGWLETTS